MLDHTHAKKGLVCVSLILLLAVPASGQIEDQISAYTGANAAGYLQPLADAFGTALNDGFHRSAYIPINGFHVGLGVHVMGVMFGDDDRTFKAVTEGGFQPEMTTDAPTVVGSGEAVILTGGQGGTSFAFPGGFDLNSFGLAVPQLTLAAKGTEGMIRWIGVDTGDAELGDISLFGLGARHMVSQHFGDLPVDLALGFLWQSFTVGQNTAGDDFISSGAFTIGAQGSKRFPAGFITFEPYTALSIDTFKMEVAYESDDLGDIEVDLDRYTTLHWTLGLGINLVAANLYGELNVAGQTSFSFGLALGNLNY